MDNEALESTEGMQKILVTRKMRRAAIAYERRQLCLGRSFPSGNWIPRKRAGRVMDRLEAAHQEQKRRRKAKIAAIRAQADTLSEKQSEHNDDAREEADQSGHPLPEGLLAPVV